MSAKKTPRPHQVRAIKDVVKGFKTNDRGKLIMACGTGKTLVANWVREKMKARVTLFMAPSNALLAQTLREWKSSSTQDFEALAVSSDSSVGDADDDIRSGDIGARVTTDPSSIQAFISGHGQRVIFSTYQSSDAVRLAMEHVGCGAVDLTVADEAHRTAGGVSRLFSTVLDKEKILSKKRLFMTATPRFYVGLAGDEPVASMDDAAHYGPVFHELRFADAIALGLLTDYEVHVVFTTSKEAEHLIAKDPHVRVGGHRVAARELAIQIALLRAIKAHGLRRIITFHSTCAKAESAAAFIPEVQRWMPSTLAPDLPVWSRTVNYHQQVDARHATLKEFASLSESGVLTNARCLGEGVDCPSVDAIAFMDTRQSKIDIVQSVGRAIRLSPDKKKSVVIVPVIMSDSDSEEDFDARRFTPVMNVLNALRSHDSTLLSQMEHWNKSGATGHTGGPMDRADKQRVTFSTVGDLDPAVAEWFMTRVLKARKSWHETCSQVVAFQQANGRLPRPKENHLGNWLNRQSHDEAQGLLAAGQAAALASIPGYIPGVSRNARWQHAYKRTLASAKSGSLKARTPEYYWLTKQRVDARAGRVPPDRIRLLGAIPGWSTDHKSLVAQRILKRKAEFEAFVEANGQHRPSSGSPQGSWFLSVVGRAANDSIVRRLCPKVWYLKYSALPCVQSNKQATAEHKKRKRFEAYVSKYGERPNVDSKMGRWFTTYYATVRSHEGREWATKMRDLRFTGQVRSRQRYEPAGFAARERKPRVGRPRRGKERL